MRRPGLVVFAFALPALVFAIAAASIYAQTLDDPPTDTDDWVTKGGTVERNPTTLTIREGETASYGVRLSRQPMADGWWVIILADGFKRYDGMYDADGDGQNDVSWVPSVGWEFKISDRNNNSAPTPWRNFSIRALQDDDDEDQTIILTHEMWDHESYCPPGLHGSGRSLAMVTIHIIDDERHLPTLSISDETVEEGRGAQFVATLSSESQQTVTVDFETSNNSAVASQDFEATSGTLTFSSRTTQQTIKVITIDDTNVEPEESFVVTLSNPSGATLSKSSGTGTITDNDGGDGGNGGNGGNGNGDGNGDGNGNGDSGGDGNGGGGGPSLPTLSIADSGAAEGEAAQFDVTLSASSKQAVTVDYRTNSATATEDTDYDRTSGLLTFMPGDKQKTVSVQTREDKLDEPDETFTVVLSNPSGATLADDTASGTIADNDVAALSIADATVDEGETARFAVTLSPASAETVTVRYRTAGGSAAAGLDFDAVSGTLTFGPRITQQIIAVPTRKDELDEPDETFTVVLSNPSGATLADDTASGTIADNDVAALSIADATAAEGETARFAVTLSPASAETVTVRYRTAGGTAAAGLDFDAVSGTLTFGPRITQQIIAVPTRKDELDEPDETFTVVLSNPSGATLADDTASGTITDDDVRSLEPINQELLPELGRALAFTAVRCRIEQAFSDMARGWATPSVTPPLALAPPAQSLAGHSLDWIDADTGSQNLERALGNTSFMLPQTEGDGGTMRFATWGCGDYRDLAGNSGGEAGAWEGKAFSMQVGADAIVGSNLLAGVSLSQSRVSLDFDEASGNGQDGGRYDLQLTGVHPYLGLWLSSDLGIWGTLGLGRGELRVRDDVAGASLTSAATLASGTVGVNGRLLELGGTTLRLKGEWALARLDVAGSSVALRKAAIDLQRLRLAVEVEHEEVVPYVGVLVPWGELGLRHDGGDGATGASVELGGGLHYRNIEQGWNAEVYGRWLAVQDDALPDEQGFGVRFRYDPEAPGFGPWVSLTQTWDETASGLHRLWEDGASNPVLHGSPARRLDVEVGYGFKAFRGRGALTPFVALSLESDGSRSYRVGNRLAPGSSAILSLEAERREYSSAPAHHVIVLRAIARF